MSLAAVLHERDVLAPRRPAGMRLGLALAVAAHALLILALAFGIAWKTSEPDGLVAELWAPTVQQAAPRATAPDPQPTPTPTPPLPTTSVQPPPEPPRPVQRTVPPEPAVAPKGPSDAEIALEKERQRQKREAAAEREKDRREKVEQDKRLEQQDREKQAREKQVREKQRLAQQQEREEQQRREKADAEKRRLADAEREKREEKQQAAARDAQLRRTQALAGATGEPSSTGTAARSAGPSAGYAGRIRARVKPNITLTGDVPGNPTAVVEVRAAPDGTIVGRRIVQSSGSPSWDETVLRAIDKTEILPRDTDGSVPSPITIAFRPRE